MMAPAGTRLVVRLDEVRATDLQSVGGKAANLGELLHAGFPVPTGFCVTTDAFKRFLASVPRSSDWLDEVAEVDADDVGAVRALGRGIREELEAGVMPEEVRAAVVGALAEAGEDVAYAVRSSATAEDLPDASFAGQQETVLNVHGAEQLLEAVQRCWVSLFTDRAITYRARNGYDARSVHLAVVVQRMVPADVSGVLFTVDPVSQHRLTIAIDAVAGLGEALVGGQVTPSSFRIDRRDLSVVARAGEGTGRGSDLLRDDQLQALARLGVAVEAHYATPQDLEWAYADDRLYLLQARPITSLFPIENLASPDGTLRVYFSVGHQQSMTRAMPTLAATTVLALLPGGDAAFGDHRDSLRFAAGHPYVDLTVLLRSRTARRALEAMLSQLDARAPEAVAAAMQRPEFAPRPGPRPSPRTVLRAARLPLGVLGRVVWGRVAGLRARTEARMDAFEASVRGSIDGASDGRERVEQALKALRATFSFLIQIMPVAAAGVVATRVLTRSARRWLSDEELESLTLGLPGNVVNDMNLALDDLATRAQGVPDVARSIDDVGVATNADDVRAMQATWRSTHEGETFAEALDAFLRRYGARAPNEIDLSVPRWRDEPQQVLALVAASLHRAGPTYRERVTRFEQEREAAFGRLVERAGRGPVGPLRTAWLRRLYRVMVELGGMREHHKFAAMRVFARVRPVAEEAGDVLVARGVLDDPSDVWHLSWRQVLDALQGSGQGVRAKAAAARAMHVRNQRFSPPMVLTSDGEIPSVEVHRFEASEGALVGQPVSIGRVEGVVRVVRDPTRDELEPGEILVAEFTDPGWTPLFMNAAGLILEVGGTLTHGAVVAREYGIPAVVGVRGATTVLKDGERVQLDGMHGRVVRLDDATEGADPR